MYLQAQPFEKRPPFRLRLAALLLAGLLLPGILPAQTDSTTVLDPESAISAQTGRIVGRVFNTQTGRYVGRARIELQPMGRVVFSNDFGEYEFYNVPTGTVTLRLTYTGQEEESVQVQVTPDETTRQDFTLLSGRTISRGRGEAGTTREQVFELEEYVVESADSFESLSQVAIQEERFSVNLKNVVSADAYGIVAQGNVGEFVKFLPGVTIDYGGTYTSGADANAIRIRGYDASQTRVTIDGIPVANAQPGTLDPAVGLDMLSINNASRVEVIKVPSPDEPGGGIGGTVNLISKTAFEYPEPSLRLRLYLNMNSENLDIFSKQPGPMNEATYRTLPGFDLSYNYPVNKNFGFTVSVAMVNQANENHTIKTDWDSDPDWGIPSQRNPGSTFSLEAAQGANRRYHHWLTQDPKFSDWQAQYGEDWSQWDEAVFEEIYVQPAADPDEARSALRQVKRIPVYDIDGNLIGAQSQADIDDKPNNLPVYYDADGNRVGYTFWDSAHPWINNLGITDSPRISMRNSGSIKFDWRPLEGLVLTANGQMSTFEAQDAGRRFEMKVGNRSGIKEFGPDYFISRDGRGGSDLNLTALDREGLSYSGYLKAEYIRGPWNIRAHISQSYSEGDLKSIENGHFSGLDTNMGNIDRAEFHDIRADGYPREVYFYTYEFDDDGNKIGESLLDPTDLSNYNISGVDAEDPQASRLRVLAGDSHTEDTITTAKFDLKRDLDFLPFDSFNLAIKVGADYESQEQVKSGQGTGYGFQYLGQSGVVLELDDFLDENYLNVDPGFGFEPREWPDLFKMYDFFKDNPDVFSDSYDEPFVNAAGVIEGNTVAADNYNSFASQNKSITETTTAYYVQLEGQFLNNRLSVVGGFRYSEESRKGRRALTDSDWSRLRLDQDANNDGFYDIIRDLEGYADQIPAPFNARYDTLPVFSVVDPPEYGNALRNFNVDSFGELPTNIQQAFRDWWAVYEQAGAVFNDGTPFDADTFLPLTDGTLATAKLKRIANFPVDETSKGRPQPIISAAYDITDNLVARVSWALRYSRPPFEGSTGTLRDIRVDEDEDGVGGSLSIQNPNVDISKTDSYQAGLTYYTNSGGKFGINGYYDIETDRQVSVEYDPGLNADRWEALMAELGYGPGDRYYDEEWTVSTSINARGTFINYGYELEASQDLGAYLEILKGLYVFASMNHKFQKEGSVAEDEQDLGFFDEPKDPEIDASGGINYRFKRFSARLNWTWRNERVRSFGEAVVYPQPTVGNAGWYTPDPNDSDDEPYLIQTRLIQPSEMRFDINLSYRINETFTLDFAARNITGTNKPNRLESVIPGLIPAFAAVENRSDYGVNFTIGLTAEF